MTTPSPPPLPADHDDDSKPSKWGRNMVSYDDNIFSPFCCISFSLRGFWTSSYKVLWRRSKSGWTHGLLYTRPYCTSFNHFVRLVLSLFFLFLFTFTFSLFFQLIQCDAYIIVATVGPIYIDAHDSDMGTSQTQVVSSYNVGCHWAEIVIWRKCFPHQVEMRLGLRPTYSYGWMA